MYFIIYKLFLIFKQQNLHIPVIEYDKVRNIVRILIILRLDARVYRV